MYLFYHINANTVYDICWLRFCGPYIRSRKYFCQCIRRKPRAAILIAPRRLLPLTTRLCGSPKK